MERRIRLFAENTRCPEMKRKIVQKGGSKAMHDSALYRTYKFAKHGGYSVEVKVPFLFEDQTTSWIRIVNGVEKYVKEAMPIQEEERASGKPAAKARPILKPSSTSNWNFVPMEQERWINNRMNRSKDLCCCQMSTFITQLLRHKKVGREEDAGVPRDKLIEKWEEVLSEDSRNWSDEVKQKLNMAPHWSAE